MVNSEWSDAHWNENTFIQCDEDWIFSSGVLLPKCSIKKLIGKDLTFKDAPIEIV